MSRHARDYYAPLQAIDFGLSEVDWQRIMRNIDRLIRELDAELAVDRAAVAAWENEGGAL